MSVENKSSPCCGGQPSTVFKILPCCDQQKTGNAELSSSCAAPESEQVNSGQTLSSFRSRPYWIKGFVDTAAGKIPLIDTSLVFRDISGAWKARWGINRMNYNISPGLYGVGNPDDTSPVLVTANYKMSFDSLRKELSGLDAWVMVIDTNGINVWCAAGKGTFGTEEIVKRINVVCLSRIVSHRTIIVPQLGAPGVAAHEVRKQSGFKVVYGPVKACDIKEFLDADMKTTREMRVVEFGFFDRLFLTPIEVVGTLKPLAMITAALFIAHIAGLITVTFSGLYPFIGAILIGVVISPALLPWIPGHAFSLKGWLMGLLWALVVLYLKGGFFQHDGVFNGLTLLLLLPAISAFLALNFTGASTYTSLSGVKSEMRFAIPAIITSASVGIVLWLAGRFI
ncbi:MAG: mercury methylation corrinoid protein HgcA [Proteobacteria bacterium]|nr:mercury methylation corrinoid protein HgcA [Pseudomonadota bacterium]